MCQGCCRSTAVASVTGCEADRPVDEDDGGADEEVPSGDGGGGAAVAVAAGGVGRDVVAAAAAAGDVLDGARRSIESYSSAVVA